MDTVSKETRSRMMSKVRGRDTGPEIALRRLLWTKGLRYRLNYGRHRIDIAFPGKRVAIFVDGCFWHMCPQHFRMPSSNTEYWIPKLKRNAERDAERTAALEKEGWTVIRIWEHELKEPAEPMERITRALDKGPA